MIFIRFIKDLFISIWRDASPWQAALIITIILFILVTLIISFVQVIVPFTYIAV